MLSSCKNALGTVPPLQATPRSTEGLRERHGGFPVARPRRLRYKLMLGLGLVVGSVVLLVVGTVYGIRAYTATVKTTERKMLELQLANILIETLKGPDQGPRELNVEIREFEQSLQAAEV